MLYFSIFYIYIHIFLIYILLIYTSKLLLFNKSRLNITEFIVRLDEIKCISLFLCVYVELIYMYIYFSTLLYHGREVIFILNVIVNFTMYFYMRLFCVCECEKCAVNIMIQEIAYSEINLHIKSLTYHHLKGYLQYFHD